MYSLNYRGDINSFFFKSANLFLSLYFGCSFFEDFYVRWICYLCNLVFFYDISTCKPCYGIRGFLTDKSTPTIHFYHFSISFRPFFFHLFTFLLFLSPFFVCFPSLSSDTDQLESLCFVSIYIHSHFLSVISFSIIPVQHQSLFPHYHSTFASSPFISFTIVFRLLFQLRIWCLLPHKHLFSTQHVSITQATSDSTIVWSNKHFPRIESLSYVLSIPKTIPELHSSQPTYCSRFEEAHLTTVTRHVYLKTGSLFSSPNRIPQSLFI